MTRQIKLWEEQTPEEIRDSVKSKEDIIERIQKIQKRQDNIRRADVSDDNKRAQEEYVKAADSIIQKLRDAESEFS